MKKITQASTTVEALVWQTQSEEIAKLRGELAALKTKIVAGFSSVQTTNVTVQAELKGQISNLQE